MSFLRNLFRGAPSSEAITQKPDPLKQERVQPLVHASYPPRHDGIPIASVAELMGAQADLMRRLNTHAACLKADFKDRFELPVANLAGYISNIPGSKDSIYGGPGGLFRACLECAFFSYQASDGKIFTGQLGVEDRYLLEKRWRYICFISGLLFPLGQTLEKIRVTNDAGENWLIRAEPFSQWASKSGIGHFYVGWPREEVEPGPSVLGGSISIQIAGTAAIRYVEEGSSALTTAFSEVASNIRNEFNSIAFDLVSSMWERLKKNELARLPQNYGRVQFGQHNAPIIVDAMRECIASGKWVVNSQAVLADDKGVYLIWPRAAQDLLASAKLTSLKGLPTSASGLMQVMLDEKMLHTDAQQSAYVDVADSDGVLHLAVKLVKPDSCVEGYVPSDYLAPVLAKEVAKKDPLVEVDLEAKNKKRKAPEANDAPATTTEEAKTERRIPEAPPPAADPLAATLGMMSAAAPVAAVDAPSAAAPKADTEAPKPQPAATVESPTAPAAPAKSQAVPEATGAGAGQAAAGVPADGAESSEYVVPAEVEKQLGKPFSIMLARVVKEMQKKENAIMVITTNREYIGIPFEAVSQAITAPSDLLGGLQKHGWLHPDPTKPRAMIHTLSVSSGGSVKAQYVTLSRAFVKKAKLPF